MKTILAILLLFPIAGFSQKWTKQYTTLSGQTIILGDHIKIGLSKSPLYIWPKHNPDAMRMSAAERYLKTDIPGKVYRVARLSRIPDGHNYKEVAIFEIKDPQINRFLIQEYYVDIEAALSNGEVELIKQD